jgi:uncharacterized protein YlxP (DUF503 family)
LFVAVLRVHLHFPDVGSLKGKRSELNSIKAHLRQRHGASVADVEHQETWQRATLAVAVVGHSASSTRDRADDVRRYLDVRLPQGVRVEDKLASWSDLESLG